MAEEQRDLVLNNGTHMPLVGLGTFLSKPGEVKQAVKHALSIGYRHIDCAEIYNNQKEIGEALSEVYSEGKISRKDIWITSKLHPCHAIPDKVESQLNQTLKDLQTDYLDLYLIHLPVSVENVGDTSRARRGVSMESLWKKLEAAVDAGKTKSIGISNFPTVIVNDLLNYCRIKPVINQIERHPYLVQREHVAWQKSQGIEITAYAALGAAQYVSEQKVKLQEAHVPLLNNPVVEELAKKKGKTPAQILIRYHVDGKVVVIPKSVNPKRIEENWGVWDFKLTADEVKRLDELDAGIRYFRQDWFGVPTFT
jgi:alcohol dehydrogenase (NADP+)